MKAVNLDFRGRVWKNWKNQVAPAHTNTAKQIVIEKNSCLQTFLERKKTYLKLVNLDFIKTFLRQIKLHLLLYLNPAQANPL